MGIDGCDGDILTDRVGFRRVQRTKCRQEPCHVVGHQANQMIAIARGLARPCRSCGPFVARYAIPMSMVVMGVAGSGKTTIGTMLADVLGCAWLEGDSVRRTYVDD